MTDSVFTVHDSLSVNSTFTANSSQITFGSNVVVNTSAIFVGNSTTNATVNSSGYYVNGSAYVSATDYTKGNAGTVGTPSNANNIFRINSNTVSGSITFDPQDNALAVGPLNITGSITISTGARVVIV